MELLHTSINDWQERFLAFFTVFFAGMARAEVRAAAQSYLIGLLMPLTSKNCWNIAESGGVADPQPHQRLLRKAKWDEAALSQGRRDYIVEHYGTDDGLFILDETGFLKDGEHSVGVQRQYTGTAGKIENSQVAVFAAYASPHGRVLYDTRLFLPTKWAQDANRREEAGVPAEVEFATKIELAQDLIDQALTDELPMAWVTADSFYGPSFALRQQLIDHGLRFVMAIRANTKMYRERPKIFVNSPARTKKKAGRPRRRKQVVGELYRADDLAKMFTPSDWKRFSIGEGSKGPRVSDWAMRRVAVCQDDRGSQDLWFLARRSISRPSEVTYFLAWAPAKTSITELATVAGARWQIEECFAEAKGEVGLADYQVRKWTSWQRHMQLAMLAHLFLAELRREHGLGDVLAPLSIPETRRLLRIVLQPEPRPVQHSLNWSIWRRNHNRKARESHYRRRLSRPLKPK
ncbi:MAG: IS701 family transposase [Bradymonadaceae bacterium]